MSQCWQMGNATVNIITGKSGCVLKLSQANGRDRLISINSSSSSRHNAPCPMPLPHFIISLTVLQAYNVPVKQSTDVCVCLLCVSVCVSVCISVCACNLLAATLWNNFITTESQRWLSWLSWLNDWLYDWLTDWRGLDWNARSASTFAEWVASNNTRIRLGACGKLQGGIGACTERKMKSYSN